MTQETPEPSSESNDQPIFTGKLLVYLMGGAILVLLLIAVLIIIFA